MVYRYRENDTATEGLNLSHGQVTGTITIGLFAHDGNY
jgi:hypothetical protein